MPLDATVSGPSSNSYLTRADATAILTGNPHAAAWTSASDEQKDWALMAATRAIDATYSFHGTVADADQALAWPRSGLLDRNGRTLPDDDIPSFVEEATVELAISMLDASRTADQETGIREVTAGPVKVVFDSLDRANLIPSYVDLLLAPYAVDSAGGIATRLVRT